MRILNVAKAALYGIFLNYYCYYVLTGSFVSGGTVLFLAIALMCVGADVIRLRYIHVGNEIRCWIAYAILSLITTAIVLAGNTSFFDDLVKFVQRLLIIMMVAYICEREGSIRFGLRLMSVTAIALAISVLMVTGDYQLRLDITSGANLSANDTGAILAFGCFATLFAWGKRGNANLWISAFKAAGLICCLSTLFLSGSRKSLYALLIMLGLLLILCFPDYGRHVNITKVFVVLAVGVAAYLFINEYLLHYMEDTSLYARLFGRGSEVAEESDESRWMLIRTALQDFLTHPLFGLGFAQYQVYHGVYSHSTYFEPLACSGVIGLLYLYPYYSIVKKQIQLIRVNKPGSHARLKQKELFIYLCMALFIAGGIPYMYKDAPCILLGTFIASQKISFEELEEKIIHQQCIDNHKPKG